MLQRAPPGRWMLPSLNRLKSFLDQGMTLTEALRQLGSWMPVFDVALIQAGEHSGRLDACFKLLAGYYRERAQLGRRVLADLAYPAFVLHAAVFIFPFPQLFLSGNLAAYLAQTVGLLAPLYLLVGLLLYAAQGSHGELWRAWIERVLDPLPWLGKARRELALARLAAALEALISAGLSITEGWELAADASGSPALRRAVASWKPAWLEGQTPAETLRDDPAFPELFANLYSTGEIGGQLDTTLARLHALYQEEASRKFHLLAEWLPRLLYLAVMLGIAYRIVTFYQGYFQGINQVIGL
jgi:type IV pilus assembly protein PilC